MGREPFSPRPFSPRGRGELEGGMQLTSVYSMQRFGRLCIFPHDERQTPNVRPGLVAEVEA